MKALVCTRPGKLDYAEIADPELKKGYAIVRIRNICVSEQICMLTKVPSLFQLPPHTGT
jgi:hypothetical protein